MMRKEGRQADSHGGRSRAGDFGQLVAEVGGAVDGHRSGGGFCNGGHVEEFVFVQPSAALDELFFQQGNHGVAAAEGEQTDFEKGEKQRPEAFGLLRRSVMFHGQSLLSFILHAGKHGVNSGEKAGFCFQRLYNPAKRRYSLPIPL